MKTVTMPPTVRHPLFDPESYYGRCRARVYGADKTRGWFYWLISEARRNEGAWVKDGSPNAGQPLLGHPARLLDYLPAEGFFAGHGFCLPAEACLWIGADGPEEGVGLHVDFRGPTPLGAARAFLIDDDILPKLTAFCPSELATSTRGVLAWVLRREVVASFPALAGLLSAMPEVDFTAGPDGTEARVRFPDGSMPEGLTAFPPRRGGLNVVVVPDEAG